MLTRQNKRIQKKPDVSWRVIHQAGKLFISKICCFRPVPLWKCRIYVLKGASRQTGSHVSLCSFPAASFKSILNRFEGYRKPNDKFVPLSSAAVNWRSAPKSCRNAIYPGWLRAPASNGKIHYIIKGIIGNKQGFVLVIVLTSNSLFDVIKIYAVRRTLNGCGSIPWKQIPCIPLKPQHAANFSDKCRCFIFQVVSVHSGFR